MQPENRHSRAACLLSLAVLLSACSSPASETAAPVILEPTPRPATAEPTSGSASAPGGAAATADIIFHNGIVLTMDDAHPTASAVRILGESIAAVGDDPTVLAEAGPATTIVDLGGRTLMPGFVDAHSHMFQEPDPDAVQDALLRTGVTTTAEMYVDPPLLDRLLDLDAQGELRVRLSAYLLYDTSCGDVLDEWWRAYPATRVPGEMLRIGGLKVFTDGGSCNAPAVTFDYGNGVGTGDLYFTQPQLEAALRTIDGAGYQAAVHALGDRALDVVLGAFENLWGGDNPRRHRIEHNAVLRPDQLARYSAAQPVATIFAPFATCHKLGSDTRFKYEVPEANRTWEWPWRDLIDANPGLRLAWHGDMPHVYPPDAAYQLWAIVTRAELAADGSICQPPDWIAHNALTVDEALHLMTTGAAYALDRDLEVGSLAPGKYADMIILSANPITIPPAVLKDIQVVMTMVGGEVEFCSIGMEALCPAPAAADTPTAEASPSFRDDFDGALEPGWTWFPDDSAAGSLTEVPGWLRLPLSSGSFVTPPPPSSPRPAPSVLLRPAPQGDFDVQTRLRVTPTENFQLAGLALMFDDTSVLQFGRGFCEGFPPCVGDGLYFDNIRFGMALGDNFATTSAGAAEVTIRLVRRGDTYTASYQSEGETWIEVGSHAVDRPPRSVGLVAGQSPSAGAVAEFDFFEMTSP